MSHPLDILRNIFNLSPDLIEKLNGKIKEMHMPKGSTIDGNKNIQQNTYYISHGAAAPTIQKMARNIPCHLPSTTNT